MINAYRTTKEHYRSLPTTTNRVSRKMKSNYDMETFIKDSSARLYAKEIEYQFKTAHKEWVTAVAASRFRSQLSQRANRRHNNNVDAMPAGVMQQQQETISPPSCTCTIPIFSCSPIRNPRYYDFFLRISINEKDGNHHNQHQRNDRRDDGRNPMAAAGAVGAGVWGRGDAPIDDDDATRYNNNIDKETTECWQGFAKVIHDDTTLDLRLDVTDILGSLHDNLTLPYKYTTTPESSADAAHAGNQSTFARMPASAIGHSGAVDNNNDSYGTLTSDEKEMLLARLRYGGRLSATYTLLACRIDRVCRPVLVFIGTGAVVTRGIFDNDDRVRRNPGLILSQRLQNKLWTRNNVTCGGGDVRTHGGDPQESDLYEKVGGTLILPRLQHGKDAIGRSDNGQSFISKRQTSRKQVIDYSRTVELKLTTTGRLDCDCDGRCSAFCPRYREKQDKLDHEAAKRRAEENSVTRN